MTPEGACPSCGRVLDAGEGVAFDARKAAKGLDLRELAGNDEKVPWHFKLMVGAAGGYLAWRAVQLVVAIVT
jgi:hypothetical protein